ncbi:MAG TPA: tripartite tricarboxylate transporter substrate binding protein [Pseudonocardia sp.]|jgi:tripartite-type tricarboxylate transporter receptor subunit TctC|uniref:tripartite tricarboxylate transporter substrate binding protein n=1 Tax=Pseudonocardia sp. TaxID=60912 RepID=UPI002BC5D01C|nr:tripartite tricarboxylate transporter substrate binding protein [Pseudonocardia sp.]HTF51825.1 tripartite tricarboxylate transporter substrate binding protein [Pseudonocardia sp.]
MRIPSTKVLALVAGAAAVVLSACAVQGGSSGGGAGEYPSRPVEFTVPTQPGGSTDLVTRALTRSLEAPLGAQTVVVNKPGANGKIAGKDVFSGAPDGYRVAVMPQSLFAIGPLMINDPDAIKLDDMSFVKGLAVEDYVLAVPVNSRFRTVPDLVTGGRVAYGTTGAGTGSQLSQALLFGLAKVPAAPVPFDGGAPLLNALLGGKVDAGSLQIAEAFKQIEAGTLRPLMVFGTKRVEALPEVPTATELGYPIVVDQRRFVAAPAGLPSETRDELAVAIDKAVASPEYAQTLKSNYIGRWDANGDEVRAQLTQSLEQFRAMTQQLGVSLAG